ncbi:hypothetical protein CHCC5022_0329 [Bacillus paralicheniformis]|nr:hypothetical protein CHCC5022_0329 [Bacillus paralicheniformis]TWJ80530.1 hypothetical protein CHCC4186_0126 [Bacillus paralicheniformis]
MKAPVNIVTDVESFSLLKKYGEVPQNFSHNFKVSLKIKFKLI